MGERNWAGNLTYRARRLHRPASLDELRHLLATTGRIRVLGSRHSFSDIADADELVSLDALPGEVAVDHAGGTVSVPPATRYGDLAMALDADGLALANLASLPHISVAGAVATATHGSGDANGNLATAVSGVELVTSSGDIVRAERGDPDFDGIVVGLGALGAVTRLRLDVEPAYEVRQRVFEGLAWDVLLAQLDTISALGYSVSVFTRLGEAIDQVWVKSRLTGTEEDVRDELFGARPATVDRHPILGVDPVNCTRQLGVAGPWWDRLPHFRMGFKPSAGDELQSEFLMPRSRARAAIEAIRTLGPTLRPLVQVCELRTVAADRLWMSPQHDRSTLGIHFTWVPDEAAVRRALADLEEALLPLDARPHWGKVFRAGAAVLAPQYPRLPDFVALAERLDGRGAFRNAWFERHVEGI
ncbi:MAG TPA: D-arabinono-1,4-lactone oxidase [Solirubrobacteraceae bacterium]|nr:D-arabinono-1,4-lactone oxidase [Solirubrobacteraceae bacterium]